MTNESLWVRSYLATYCGPGRHDFITAWSGDAGVRWCRACMKEEPLDGSACLVCDLAGAHGVRLVDVRTDASVVDGALCDPCWRGFDEREVIGGWKRSGAPGRETQHLTPGSRGC
ncbi:MAG: hypothetical protein HYX53_16290 [Chloroflexi bacterium]|nr:hypothetical protein [Chloroflexota bacterium]